MNNTPNFLTVTKQAFVAMKAVPVRDNGKRNGNQLNVPYHRYAEQLQTLGYDRCNAYRIATEMKAKFK